MDYKFCPECGQKLAKDARFCPNCGTKQPDMNIGSQAASTAPASSTPAGSITPVSPLSEPATTPKPRPIIDQSRSSRKPLVQMGMPASDDLVSSSSASAENSTSGQADASQQAAAARMAEQQSAQAEEHAQAKQEQFYQQSHQQDQTGAGQQEQFYQQAGRRQQEGGPQPSANQYQQGWRPYNETGQPSLMNSFSLWMHSLGQTNKCMGRADYWWGYLAYYIIICVIEVLLWIVTSMLLAVDEELGMYLGGLLWIVLAIFCVYVSLVTIVQRLHDTGHSGWNWLWCLTGIGGIYVLFLLCQPTNWNEQRWVRVNG